MVEKELLTQHYPTREELPDNVVDFFVKHWNQRVLAGRTPESITAITRDYLKHLEVLVIADGQEVCAARAFSINGLGSLSLTAPEHRNRGYGFKLITQSVERVIAHAAPNKPTIILPADTHDGKKLCDRCVAHFGNRAEFLVG